MNMSKTSTSRYKITSVIRSTDQIVGPLLISAVLFIAILVNFIIRVRELCVFHPISSLAVLSLGSLYDPWTFELETNVRYSTLYSDNARKFRSRALRSSCSRASQDHNLESDSRFSALRAGGIYTELDTWMHGRIYGQFFICFGEI